MSALVNEGRLTRKDFATDQEVRWCPGCGDYAVLAAVQKVMPELGVAREQIVWVSGIGCSSRFPYYMNTYGFHTIHGRAPAIAMGIKAANPTLSVWIATGDGDGLSIGGNHLLHCLRRNLDVNILMFNNRIYGLTKGQYSPTSEIGKVTKSTPHGSVDQPVDPAAFALGAGASFVARAIDVDSEGLVDVLRRAAAHRGTSFVEVLQNCNVFNDGAFDHFATKEARPSKTLKLQHGKPLVFGESGENGIRLNPRTLRLEVVSTASVSVDELVVHDEHNDTLAGMLARSWRSDLPVPLGVLYSSERDTYESLLTQQRQAALSREGQPDLARLLKGNASWVIPPRSDAPAAE